MNKYLKKHYDKLLHILGSFAALLWLDRFVPCRLAIVIVIILMVGRAVQNQMANPEHKHVGDWIANVAGFLLWGIWILTGS